MQGNPVRSHSPDRSDASVNKLVAALKAVLAEYPDHRVGQVLSNVAGNSLFYIENDDLTNALLAYVNPSSGE